LANIWTTNDNNMYSAALNLARAMGLSRRAGVLICVMAGGIFAMYEPGKLSFLFPFLLFLGGTAPALGGVVLSANLLREHREGYHAGVADGWIAWLVGAAAGFFSSGVWTIPAGFVVAVLVMVTLGTWRGRVTLPANDL
jgi:purine-cytosine permease-like protein